MSIADELLKLQQLHQNGALSDQEYEKAKAALLSGQSRDDLTGTAGSTMEQQTRQWAMFLHFSILAGFLFPLAGLLAPIVIWQVKKTELPGIDLHGKVVVNWILSLIIYAVICVPLVFVIVGIPLLILLGIVGIIFPIIGGIKANSGEIWRYPLSISFLE